MSDVVPFAHPEVPKPETIAADPVASAEWDRIVVDGCFLPREAGVVAIYCSAFSRVEKLRARLNALPDDKLFITTKAGVLKSHPVLGSLNNSERILAMHAARLGLTPVDRTRVKKPAASPGAPRLDRFIKK